MTLRDETEWIETVQLGWNVLAGGNDRSIVEKVLGFSIPLEHPELYGSGQASQKIVDHLLSANC